MRGQQLLAPYVSTKGAFALYLSTKGDSYNIHIRTLTRRAVSLHTQSQSESISATSLTSSRFAFAHYLVSLLQISRFHRHRLSINARTFNKCCNICWFDYLLNYRNNVSVPVFHATHISNRNYVAKDVHLLSLTCEKKQLCICSDT